MSSSDSIWDQKILDSMRPGAVTFAWDDGEILTIPAVEGCLKSLNKAWEWVEARMKELSVLEAFAFGWTVVNSEG